MATHRCLSHAGGDRYLFSDVTGERDAREALREKSEQAERPLAEIESVCRTAPIGLALFDTQDFRYPRLNNKQAEFFGLELDQIVVRTLTEMAPIYGLRELFNQVMQGKPVINFPIDGEVTTRPGVHRYWTVSYFPVTAADGTVRRHGCLARSDTTEEGGVGAYAKRSEDAAHTKNYVQTAERELRRVSVIANQTFRFHKAIEQPTGDDGRAAH